MKRRRRDFFGKALVFIAVSATHTRRDGAFYLLALLPVAGLPFVFLFIRQEGPQKLGRGGGPQLQHSSPLRQRRVPKSRSCGYDGETVPHLAAAATPLRQPERLRAAEAPQMGQQLSSRLLSLYLREQRKSISRGVSVL